MGLSLYNKKRKFSETPEPVGKEKSSKSSLRFVIQKHDASSLHYDFRLEMNGVLKSWAVPKGPSLNPADKRLAMLVEDHPYDYKNFEGVIPEGNYGAGTVIIWDEGYYEPEAGKQLSKKEQENVLLKELEMGSLKFSLHGKKLKGSYTLRMLRKGEEKAWLLIKSRDEFADEIDVTLQDTSVKSGKTLAAIAARHGVTLNHEQEDKAVIRKEVKKTRVPKKQSGSAAPKNKSTGSVPALLEAYKTRIAPAAMPHNIKPALATLVDASFDDPEWIYEIKWDGYRALSYVNNNDVTIISRNNKPFTDKYAPVTAALQELGINAVLDGEIVATDEKGLANFQMLQNWQNAPVQLQFFIFDILWLEGYDITKMPLIERKKLLKQLLPEDNDLLRYSDHVIGKGKDFYKAALKQGLEGIMAKRANSTYEIGKRTPDWLKIKVNKRQEVVIVGFTEPRKTRKFFGALLLGVYDGDELMYIGHSGSGFNTKSLQDIWNRLQPLITDNSPFVKTPRTNMPATWVKPELVCEIKFTEWTKERIARHPIFMGLREDKKAKDVHFEEEKNQSVMVKKAATKKAGNSSVSKAKAADKVPAKKTGTIKTSGLQLNIEEGENQHIVLDKIELSVTNLDKIYWKKEGYRKIDSINHYLRMAPYILPYLLDRPHSLNRHPNGIDAPNFFQKDMKGKQPDWLQTHNDFSESTNTNVEYLVCTNEASLVYMANLGCIEINPWHAKSQTWQQPDWCLIDLDPEGVPFEAVIQCAQVIKNILDAIGAEGYCKTSGATGMHIYIPLGGRYNFEQSKQLAELICTLVLQELPNLTSMERNPAKRKERVYLDFLQNKETQTAAAPYSIRPKPHASVSTPLHWDEVKKGLTPATFTIKNIYERVKTEGDLFKPVLGKGISLEKVLKKLQGILP